MQLNKSFEIIVLIKEIKENFKKFMSEHFNNMQFTHSQWMLLGVLMKNGNMKISDLSKKMGLSNSTVSGIIDRLENQGFVKRARDEKDRRKVFVEITEKFKEIAEKSHINVEKQMEEMLKNVPEDDLDKVIEGLKILNNILEER
ncbi:MarR family transcriptional regulator [Marinitoga sp. 1197]|nr:MarR family transcriptional regulator [Marinitoga sp. 1197]